jgi:hypothetical protein
MADTAGSTAARGDTRHPYVVTVGAPGAPGVQLHHMLLDDADAAKWYGDAAVLAPVADPRET